MASADCGLSVGQVSIDLPRLARGVSVALLRRVWNATPAERKSQRATLLDSVVTVTISGHVYAKPLRDLTLTEVESAIGAVSPRFVVRFYQPGRLGTQIRTFVDRTDAERFAAQNRLYGKPAEIRELSL